MPKLTRDKVGYCHGNGHHRDHELVGKRVEGGTQKRGLAFEVASDVAVQLEWEGEGAEPCWVAADDKGRHTQRTGLEPTTSEMPAAAKRLRAIENSSCRMR